MTKDVEDGFHSDNYQQTCTTIIDYLLNPKVPNISTLSSNRSHAISSYTLQQFLSVELV